MRIKTGNVNKIYSNVVILLFFSFIFGVLSFGRAFSIMHINIFGFKIFITEIFLLICFPLVLLYDWNRLKLPRSIIISIFLFFFLGYWHSFNGILDFNLFSLRDIVLYGYLLFLPLTLIVFSEKKMLMPFIIILMASNFINLFIGWCMFKSCPIFKSQFLMEQTRYFDLGLYYGISVSFLIPFLSVISKKKPAVLIILLIAMNIYLLIFPALRTLWFALLSLFIMYFVFIRPLVFAKTLLKVGLTAILICILLFWVDFENNSKSTQKEFLLTKFKTMVAFALNRPRFLKIIAKDVLDPREISSAYRSLPKTPVADLNLSSYSMNLGNLSWRFEIWKQSIMFGLKSPLFGRGFGTYPHYRIYHDPYYEEGSMSYLLKLPVRIDNDSGVTPVHNYLITIFFKMGLIGLALFTFITAYTFIYGVRYIHKARDEFLRCFLIGSLGAFVFWHAMALFFDVIDSPPTSIFLWIIMGLIFTTIEIDKNSPGKGQDAPFPQKSGHSGELVIE